MYCDLTTFFKWTKKSLHIFFSAFMLHKTCFFHRKSLLVTNRQFRILRFSKTCDDHIINRFIYFLQVQNQTPIQLKMVAIRIKTNRKGNRGKRKRKWQVKTRWQSKCVQLHSDLDCRIVSKKDFKTCVLGQENLIAWYL